VKTDELIGLLGASFASEPAKSPNMLRRIALTAMAGAAGTLCLALLMSGVRPDLGEGWALVFLLAKLAFAIAVGGLALRYLSRIVRPGGERRVHLGIAALPFVAVMTLAVLSLANAPPAHWGTMLTGHMWLECLISIPVIAVVPFASLMWVVRTIGAPTDLVRTGALVGLASGGVSAMGYAIHCMDDTMPFVAVWYGGTIALCSLTGALLGPRLLRW
jgi:hypothetical protein